MIKTTLLIIILIISISIYKFYYQDSRQIKLIKIIPQELELKKKYPIKSYHEKLSLKCIHCHENQGNDPKKFTEVEDEQCFSCHGNKRKIANRTSYMNSLHSNPHDSMHDSGTVNFYCYECHQAHQTSENQCMNCHPSKALLWMKEYP